MKILRITSLGYTGAGSGGVENGIALVDPVLSRMGHTVRTFASDAGGDVPRFSTYTFRALSTQPFLLRVLYRAFYPHAYRALRRALADFQPDVVQVHSLFEVSPSVLFALRHHPTVVTVHGAEDYTKELLLWAFPLRFFRDERPDRAHLTPWGWAHYLYHRWVSMPLYRLGFRYVDRFVVFSTFMQRMLMRDGIESVCVPNATELYEPAPIEVPARTLLYVGRLERIKGVEYLLAAFAQIRTAHPDATLRIAGTGAYEGRLREMVRSEGYGDRVTFLGHRTRAELYAEYARASLVVVPSVWPEPFGKVGIEAMSVGRPVVGSDVGGVGEWLVHGVTGFLVPPADSSACARAVCALFSDPGLMERMASAARTHAHAFSIEHHTERIVALYETIRDGSRKRRI